MQHSHGDSGRQRTSRGIGPRTTSSKTHSVIGVSADPHAGTEDWTDGFGLNQPAASHKSPSPAPHSPASQRAAALVRIAKEENAPRRRIPVTVVSTSVHYSKPAAREPGKPAPSASGSSSRQHSSAFSGAGRSAIPADSAAASAAAAASAGGGAGASSSSSRSNRHRRGDGNSEYSSRTSQRGREDGRGASATTTTTTSRKQPRQEASAARPRRGSHTEPARPPPQQSSSSRTGGGGSGASAGGGSEGGRSRGERVDPKPKYRHSREEKVDSSNKHFSGTGRTGGGGSGARAARPWEDIVEEMNDSPTDSEVPAPQPRALRTPSAESTPTNQGRNVSFEFCFGAAACVPSSCRRAVEHAMI